MTPSNVSDPDDLENLKRLLVIERAARFEAKTVSAGVAMAAGLEPQANTGNTTPPRDGLRTRLSLMELRSKPELGFLALPVVRQSTREHRHGPVRSAATIVDRLDDARREIGERREKAYVPLDAIFFGSDILEGPQIEFHIVHPTSGFADGRQKSQTILVG